MALAAISALSARKGDELSTTTFSFLGGGRDADTGVNCGGFPAGGYVTGDR